MGLPYHTFSIVTEMGSHILWKKTYTKWRFINRKIHSKKVVMVFSDAVLIFNKLSPLHSGLAKK